MVAINTICAGDKGDACAGDAGGPLICSRDFTNGQRYLCGIVSRRGAECTNKANSSGFPGVYTDVGKFKKNGSRENGAKSKIFALSMTTEHQHHTGNKSVERHAILWKFIFVHFRNAGHCV